MDQSSSPSELRDRAVSSEPCSTRPNPFDDGDSARKRRRTSLSGSRSASVDTLNSRDDAAAVSDPNIMKVDTPEQPPPSTPAPSEPPAEPVSSKVTINLRNVESCEATPPSPSSPTPSRFQKDTIKSSVEESGVNMTQDTLAEEASSSASELDSPDIPNMSIEDDLAIYGADPNAALLSDGRAARFSAVLRDFPYHTEEETYYDTVVRLAEYFRQQTTHVDEALGLLAIWLSQCSSSISIELYPMVMEAYQENRQFWQSLPDLFYTIAHRHGSSLEINTRETINRIFLHLAKITGFLIEVDCLTLSNVATKENGDLDLISASFLRLFGSITVKDDQFGNRLGYANVPSPSDSLDALQASGGFLTLLSRFTEFLAVSVLRFPKKVMDSLVGAAWLMDSLVRDGYKKQQYPETFSPEILERSRKNMAAGLSFFTTVSHVVDVVIDKSISNLSSETATNLIPTLSVILKYSLLNSNAGATNLMHEHLLEHSELPDRFMPDAIQLGWRIRSYCKLVRSRQMQLRVTAAGHLCEDLVTQWRNYIERQEVGDDNSHMSYLRYLSDYLLDTGIVDYLLGPTCHPEITQASFNIVGFLAVTKTYTPAQTELLWQTLTSTQDPRISDAIVRMMSKVVGLLDPESLCYMCEKFYNLSIESFSPCMRDLFDQVTKQLQEKILPYHVVPLAPYKICLRLLQESSIYRPQGSAVYPEVHQFALTKLTLLLPAGPDAAGRESIWMSCVEDIAAKSETTSGSLQGLSTLLSSTLSLQMLIAEHDFIRLLVDELESTIAKAKAAGVATVFANSIGLARRRIIGSIIVSHGSTISSELGRRLWDLLVGDGAACQDDRKAAWDDLNSALKRTRLDNPFLSACLREYLPELPPACYCAGSLSFVREAIIPLANDINSIVLDDEESLKSAGLELLWQMILTAPSQTIEESAISTLVDDIYVDSKSITSYPLHRARRVHFALVQRCLQQLGRAAGKLKDLDDGISSEDDQLTTAVAISDLRQGCELQFTRSLQVLVALLRALQAKPRFAAPDLRSLMLEAPSSVDGDLADLKYQSFDGDDQTEIKPLMIGLKNTASSLLASLREATSFDNYRLYYRGQPLAPSESDICKSIEELGITSGMILVKRETGVATSPRRIKPGASPLDIEILGHFKDLWEYLSMEEKLAREIYQFLVSLPADDSILTAFEDPETSYRDVFPYGQPFKSLYALHALREYLNTRRLKSNVMQVSSQDSEIQVKTTNDQQDASTKAVSLIIGAICDPEVVERGSSETLALQLNLELVDTFLELVNGAHSANPRHDICSPSKETGHVQAVAHLLNINLQDRLLAIISSASAAQTNRLSIDVINRCFESLLECCGQNRDSWNAFRDRAEIQQLIQRLLLDDPRQIVRHNVSRMIIYKCLYDQGPALAHAIDFAELFWPIVFQLVPGAVSEPTKCAEVFSLAFQLLRKLIDDGSSIVELHNCIALCGQLLLSHTATEDIAHPDKDVVAHGLITILSMAMIEILNRKETIQIPPNFVSKLFSRHLFPPEDESGPLVPQVILHTSSRSMLYDIISAVVKENKSISTGLLNDLNTLTSHRLLEDGAEIYKYELPQCFERLSAIRSTCGYAGLRNLSNTCYLNSLFTQLFMNVGFRSFMLERRIRNLDTHQLLYETQVLFAYLQDSRRRYVEPQGCVAQIMTYEEAPIDIHNQMDVDEFYNLLFDRWEAQLSSEGERKRLRSIYGGELVQQVKSQECEHISERIEPFSAIQCDIKGKAGLEESLQAYVDGEIMEGDNKYKCSDCDRHVDAVKRACLKNIPDNLIFHLKRFDFNLRTLTRSKINDYFPFPTTIDMQPYTIEHLSKPSDDQSQKSERDMFELVGVLVHSGTAESGHYYSYVRERPSTSSVPSWVEFNDESVSSWDHLQMEAACFGGSDYRPQFDTNTTYEKVYSAYMLFYQRSSSLKKEQELLKASGQAGPYRAELHPALESQVKEDNWSIVQRHCLYDPTHMPFVYKVLANTWGSQCSEDHKQENLAMRTALGHLDQIASRTKDLPDFDQLKTLLINVCQRCPRCCVAFFEYLNRHNDVLRMLLQKNSDAVVRQDTARIFIFVLSVIKSAYPDDYGPVNSNDETMPDIGHQDASIMSLTLDMFQNIWDTFHTRINSWPECFGVMLEFARQGRYEAIMFLERDFLQRLLLAITVDQAFDLPPQYSRLLNAVSRRAARPPNYESMIGLIDELLAVVDPLLSHGNILERPEGRFALAMRGESVPFTTQEVNLLHRDWAKGQANAFVEKLILLNQNTDATDAIIRRLMGFSPMMDNKVYVTLRVGITGDLSSHSVSPFLRAAVTYCRHSINCENVHRLIGYIGGQCKGLQNAEGRSFFEFQRDMFDQARNTGETSEQIHSQSLENLTKWVPGLLGYIDRTVSDEVDSFLVEKLFKHGGDSDGGKINSTARLLAIACLEYLQDTYVNRGAPAARYTVVPLERAIKRCDAYYRLNEKLDEKLDDVETRYVQLQQAVQEPLAKLTVEELEEDGSDWEEPSVGSSEQMDNLTDVGMRIDHELV